MQKQNIKLGSLHMAALMGDFDMVNKLISTGVNIHSPDTEMGWPPIIHAAWKGSVPILEALVAAGADPCDLGAEGWTSLHMVAENGHVQACLFLISTFRNLDIKDGRGLTPIYIASAFGNWEVCEVLAANGADPNIKCPSGRTPLNVALDDETRAAIMRGIANWKNRKIESESMSPPEAGGAKQN
jgi:ankyrin repeat protein